MKKLFLGLAVVSQLYCADNKSFQPASDTDLDVFMGGIQQQEVVNDENNNDNYVGRNRNHDRIARNARAQGNGFKINRPRPNAVNQQNNAVYRAAELVAVQERKSLRKAKITPTIQDFQQAGLSVPNDVINIHRDAAAIKINRALRPLARGIEDIDFNFIINNND